MHQTVLPPEDYAEMFERYWQFTKSEVAKHGIHPDDVEDVASGLLLRFMEPRPCPAHKPGPRASCRGCKRLTAMAEEPRACERHRIGVRLDCSHCAPDGFLAKFEAGRTYAIESDGSTRLLKPGETPTGPVRTSKFTGFFRRYISLYVRQDRDKQMTKARKEPYRCDAPVSSEEGNQSLWIEVFGPNEDDYFASEIPERLLASEVVAGVQDVLDSRPVRGKRDLARLFRTVKRQMETTGRVDRRQIAREFQVSDTAVSQMFGDLREVLWEMGLGSA